jgi:predicted HAD superfamily Cof-like phosphohydrolase
MQMTNLYTMRYLSMYLHRIYVQEMHNAVHKTTLTKVLDDTPNH